MKSAVILAGMLAAGAGSRAAEPADVIRFANGDSVAGAWQGIAGPVLRWASPVFEGEVGFDMSQVLEIRRTAKLPEESGDHLATVRLHNDDVVHGKLASVDGDAVVLETAFAGTMRFNRKMVREVEIESISERTYRGPDSMNSWMLQTGKPAWQYRGGAFVSIGQGAIGRDAVMPETAIVSFDLAWRETLDFEIVLQSKEPAAGTPRTGYILKISRGNISLRNARTGGYLAGEMGALRELREQDRAKIEIRSNVKTGDVSVRVDGKLADVWKDNQAAKGAFGGALQFIAVNRSPVRISDIVVSKWDGKPDAPRLANGANRWRGVPDEEGEEETQEAEIPEVPAGRMLLANGDTLLGTVKEIDSGGVKIATSLGEVVLPVARLRSVTLEPAEIEKPLRRKGDVRAGFSDGSSLVFRLDAFDGGKISGTSQTFGMAEFFAGSFERLEMNLYNEKLNALRSAEKW